MGRRSGDDGGERVVKFLRVIPRLDIKGPNLVKGIHLEGLRVLGRPEVFAEAYYAQGADELLYMDVVASLYGRNNILDIVERTARHVAIPLTVGGGLRSLDDIKAVLRAGADKVSLNTAAVRRPEFIREASRRFGSSTIVVAIEVIKVSPTRYEAFTDNGREHTGLEACEWASRVAEMGAGELLVTSIDREGTGQGFDLELTRRISTSVGIPVIACGGAGQPSHLVDVVREGAADAVCLASMLHYGLSHLPGSDSGEGNTEFLRSGRAFRGRKGVGLQTASIGELKRHLTASGIPCRELTVASGTQESGR